MNAYSPETVNSADKEDIEKLVSGIDSLLGGDNLTKAERTGLEELKNAAKALLDKLAEVKAETEKPEITEVRDITNDNVKSDDKNDLVKAREELEKVLEDLEKNLTEDEKSELEKQLETVKDALTAIDNAEKAADEIGKLPSLDDVKLGDKDEVERVKEILDGLTENEKTMLGNDAAEKVKALDEKIAALEKISFAPSIIEGAGQSWNSVSGKNALFRSNAEFDEFVKVLVDGKELDKSNYIAYAGSTVVELKAAYLKTLSAGTHTLSVVSRNGQADTVFTVEKQQKSDLPKSGENGGIILWVTLLFISGGAAAGARIAVKKKNRSAK